MRDFNVITKPLQHQEAAFRKMIPTRVGALFMDMGTGKSLVTIMLAHARRDKISKVVWCCPVSLKRNTADQIASHTDCNSVFIFDNRVTDTNIPSASWYIVGLESIGSSDRIVMTLDKLIDENTMLVVDESSYIKGIRANRTRRITQIGRKARYRIVLSGTAVTQGIEDLYAQITFLSDKILMHKTWRSFRDAHIIYSEKYKGQIASRVGLDKIAKQLEPYVYQVTKDECLSLPEKTFASRYVDLTSEQERYYEMAKSRFLADLQDSESDFDGIAVYRLFGALRMIANGIVPAGFYGHGHGIATNKMKELKQCLSLIPYGHVIVWVEFRQSIAYVARELRENFSDENISVYFGDLSERERDDELERWRSNGGYLVATASCGGYGLTLTEAQYCIFYTCGFKYSEHIQAQDRIHRIGQKSHCHYIRIWADCGIEERVESALERKGNALDSFREEIEIVKSNNGTALQELVAAL